jgi:hypothetical protein
LIFLPQPSSAVSQAFAAHLVAGVQHLPVTQTSVPPVHAVSPQSRVPPQPSSMLPQTPAVHVVFFRQHFFW